MKLADRLFLESCWEIAAQYPSIEYNEVIVDNCCTQLVAKPEQFHVMEENGSVSSALQENGTSDSLSLITSEKAVEEITQHPVQGIDEHLVDFSEAMRTIGKALRRAVEVKASVQAEAAEWKRNFELEKSRNLQLERKGKPDAGFAVFESESLKWPGFVVFDDVNGKVLTYSAQDRMSLSPWGSLSMV